MLYTQMTVHVDYSLGKTISLVPLLDRHKYRYIFIGNDCNYREIFIQLFSKVPTSFVVCTLPSQYLIMLIEHKNSKNKFHTKTKTHPW
jgi:hypothetical protein